jgi:uncharacterized RDD family membrane protein YckC
VRTDPPAESLAGHYAGPITRIAAYAVDAFASVASYGLLLSLIAFLWQLIAREDLTLPADNSILWLAGLGVWIFVYFAGAWAVAAKTPGMAILGLRVVARNGGDLRPVQAALRALTFPLGAATLGLGYIGVLVGTERRALHDVIAGTTVVYDWDARAARWRLLSRRAAEG